MTTTLSAEPRPLGQARDGESLKADLERYRMLVLGLGASDATIIPADQVVVDERVRLKCVVPRCLRAGETPNCPPHAPELELVRRALSRFSWAVLFKCDVSLVDDSASGSGKGQGDKRRVLSFHRPSSDLVYELERQAYQDGYHLSMGFGGGSCKDYLCQGVICQFLDSGRCRFPHRARPAMEAMGIDVISLVNRVGWRAYPLLDDLSTIPCAITVGIVFIC
jgi:predicted metal-binding protein